MHMMLVALFGDMNWECLYAHYACRTFVDIICEIVHMHIMLVALLVI